MSCRRWGSPASPARRWPRRGPAKVTIVEKRTAPSIRLRKEHGAADDSVLWSSGVVRDGGAGAGEPGQPGRGRAAAAAGGARRDRAAATRRARRRGGRRASRRPGGGGGGGLRPPSAVLAGRPR